MAGRDQGEFRQFGLDPQPDASGALRGPGQHQLRDAQLRPHGHGVGGGDGRLRAVGCKLPSREEQVVHLGECIGILTLSLLSPSDALPGQFFQPSSHIIDWALRLINLEIPVLVRSLKSSNVEPG